MSFLGGKTAKFSACKYFHLYNKCYCFAERCDLDKACVRNGLNIKSRRIPERKVSVLFSFTTKFCKVFVKWQDFFNAINYRLA